MSITAVRTKHNSDTLNIIFNTGFQGSRFINSFIRYSPFNHNPTDIAIKDQNQILEVWVEIPNLERGSLLMLKVGNKK